MFDLADISVTPPATIATLRRSDPALPKVARVAEVARVSAENEDEKSRKVAEVTRVLPPQLIDAAMRTCDRHCDDETACQAMLEDLAERIPPDGPALLEHFNGTLASTPAPVAADPLRGICGTGSSLRSRADTTNPAAWRQAMNPVPVRVHADDFALTDGRRVALGPDLPADRVPEFKESGYADSLVSTRDTPATSATLRLFPEDGNGVAGVATIPTVIELTDQAALTAEDTAGSLLASLGYTVSYIVDKEVAQQVVVDLLHGNPPLLGLDIETGGLDPLIHKTRCVQVADERTAMSRRP